MKDYADVPNKGYDYGPIERRVMEKIIEEMSAPGGPLDLEQTLYYLLNNDFQPLCTQMHTTDDLKVAKSLNIRSKITSLWSSILKALCKRR